MTYIPQNILDPRLIVALGQMPALSKVSAVEVFGLNPDVDSGTVPEDLWGQGGAWVPPTTARVHDIVSTSANDASAGTGARTVRVTGLNGSYAVTTEDITMNGTTNVPTVNSYIYIRSIEVLTAGSGATNAGAITATAQTDATVSAAIVAGYGNSTLGVYQVPAGYTAYIAKWSTGLEQITAGSDAIVQLRVQPFGGVSQLRALHTISNSGGSWEEDTFDELIEVTEKGIVRMQCSYCSASNTVMQGRIGMFLVQN